MSNSMIIMLLKRQCVRLDLALFLPNFDAGNFTCLPSARLVIRLVREERQGGKSLYICDCGLGYDDILIAYACEEYRRTHGINSEDIIKRAVYNPRTAPVSRVVQAK
jgi:hypothetical protein